MEPINVDERFSVLRSSPECAVNHNLSLIHSLSVPDENLQRMKVVNLVLLTYAVFHHRTVNISSGDRANKPESQYAVFGQGEVDLGYPYDF